MDLQRLLNNRNIIEDHSLQEPGLSYNLREFGPYRVGTNIERISDGYGAVGNKLQHLVDLPENTEPDEEMARRVAKELQIDPSIILGLQPGHSWIKGNMNVHETMGNPDVQKFKKLNQMLKK